MGKITEFTAMQRIGNCLKDLSPNEKERVLAWAITFLEVERANLKKKGGFDTADIRGKKEEDG